VIDEELALELAKAVSAVAQQADPMGEILGVSGYVISGRARDELADLAERVDRELAIAGRRYVPGELASWPR